jgi:hypothetical protein
MPLSVNGTLRAFKTLNVPFTDNGIGRYTGVT